MRTARARSSPGTGFARLYSRRAPGRGSSASTRRMPTAPRGISKRHHQVAATITTWLPNVPPKLTIALSVRRACGAALLRRACSLAWTR